MDMKKLLFILIISLTIGIVSGTDLEWTELNGSAFPGRYDHASCIFNSKIWVSGGYNGTSYLNDIWYSSDGTTWTQANASPAWNARAGHAMLSLGSYMYIIGGYNGTAGVNSTYPAMYDVYRSSDGSNWTLLTNNPGFRKNYTFYGGLDSYGLAYSAATVGDSKMWLAGGYAYKDHLGYLQLSNDVFYSSDGTTWTDSGNCPSFREGWYYSDGWERSEMEWMSLAFIGGKYTTALSSTTSTLPPAGTAYSTLDGGTSWDTRTEAGYWDSRSDFGLVYLDSKLVLMGGYTTTYKKDVWYSEDEGETWSDYTDASWSARRGLCVVEWGSSMYATGGYDASSGSLGDVWRGSFNTTATAPGEDSQDTGFGLQYPPREVRFVFVDISGQPISNATVTAIPVETSLGSWDWLTNVFGFSDEVDISGSTLTGTTGSDGAIALMMVAELRYDITCIKTTDGVNHTISIYPKETEYFIRVGRLASVTDYPIYNLTAYDYNATYVRLQANYTDDADQTTPINFYVMNDTGIVYSAAFPLVAGNGTIYYDVPNTRGSTYKFGFNGTNTEHGNVSAYQGVDMKGSGPLVDYGWPDMWYWLVSIAVIFLVAGSVGEMDIKIGGILVPMFAGIFWYIGWLPSSLGVIINAVFFLGALYYMRASYKAVDT